MGKLTKSQERDLNHILGRLQRVQTFLLDNRTEVIRDAGSTGKHPINKEIGSGICYLYRAQEALNTFLNPEPTEP